MSRALKQQKVKGYSRIYDKVSSEGELSSVKRHCAVTLLLVAMALGAVAQSSMGRIVGRVTDPAGAMVPGAEVVVRNDETGVTTRTKANESGGYAFPAVQPGMYTITASMQGFKTLSRSGVRIETADVLDLELKLELGSVTDAVTVSAEAPMLESSTSSIGQMISSRLMQEMPLNSRRSLNLVATTGAAVFLAGGEQAVFSLAGGRARNQNFLLDGGNMQNMRLGLGQVDTDPPVSTIREFRILQNNYSAEYGGSAGGVVVSTTKSGTNSLHGNAYEYFRNDALEAPNFFAPTEGTRKIKAPRRYNLFGGTLGGPIVRNKTHYFVSYEGTRHSIGSTTILTVPTAAQRRGDFSKTVNATGQLIPIYDPATTRTENGRVVRTAFEGNIIPPNRLDPVAQKLIGYWPLPNRATTNVAGAQNFVANSAARRNRDNVVAKVDHTFSDSNRFYYRHVWGRDPVQNGTVYPDFLADPAQAYISERNQHTILFADTHTWSPNLLMDSRYSFSLRKNHEKSAGLGSNVIEQIGLQGVPTGAFPQITVTGIAGIGNSRERAQFPMTQHQFVNNWSWFKGSHFLRFGAEARQSNNKETARPSISGTYGFAPTATGLPGSNNTGVAFASFLVGYGNTYSQRSTDPLDRYSWYYAAFLQDDWKVTPSLTFNLGLRWETDTPMKDRNNALNGFDPYALNPVSGTPGVVKFAGVNGYSEYAYEPDWNNFGPRFGFAWQPGAKKWVVRGGFGIFFEHPLTHAAPNANTLGFETSAALNSPDNGVTPAFILGNGIQGVSPGSPVRDNTFGAVRPGQTPTTTVTFFEWDRPTGYAMQGNFGIQRELPGNMVAEVTYLTNLGRKMPNSDLTVNQVPPSLMLPGNAQSRRPYPQFSGVAIRLPAIGYMNYHAGLVKLDKRLSRGLSLNTTYTWSRNIGNIDHDSIADVGDNQLYQNAYDRRFDKGPNAIDIVHRFTWSSVYDLPWGKGRAWMQSGFLSRLLGGWTLGAISYVQSGGPFTAVMNTDTTNAFPAGTQRPNVLRNPNLPVSERTVDRWFDTEAFLAVPANTFGNAGRGILRADGRINFDFSLNKRFYLGERVVTKFTGEFFNAFNHPDFAPPNRSFGNPNFGTVGDATEGRVVQLGLEFQF